MGKKLKLESILKEQYLDKNNETLKKIASFLTSASPEFFQTDEGKKFKSFFEKILPTNLLSPVVGSVSSKTELQKTRISSDDDFYKSILSCIGAPATVENMKFLYAWRQAEGGTAKYNPFNTSRKKQNATFYNCLSKDSSGKCISGVKNYSTKEDGIQATCETLKLPMYSELVNQLKSGTHSANELAKNNLTALKTWGTGELIAKVLSSYKEGSKPNPPSIAA